jgi:two-component sensor histidine kinase
MNDEAKRDTGAESGAETGAEIEAGVRVGVGVWDERRLRIASDAAGVALWSWNVDTDHITMDTRAFDVWGLPPRNSISFEELSACIHPADVDKVRAAFSATRDLHGPYEIDFRILHDADVRWVSARGRGDEEGIIHRIMYGVFLDVTFRKLAEEQREMVTREMHHRIKNLFGLSSALASIASRGTDSKEAMLDDLTRRLRGLAAAHDLILPGFHNQRRAVPLDELLTALLQAYALDTGPDRNVLITAPGIMVGETSITTLAMIIHELATNSAKYGALSTETGRLVLSCHEVGDGVELVWTETGAPTPAAEVREAGFGSLLTDRVIRQVNGTIRRHWTADGLIVTLGMSTALLGA